MANSIVPVAAGQAVQNPYAASSSSRSTTSDGRVGEVAAPVLVVPDNLIHLWMNLLTKSKPIRGRWNLLPADVRVCINAFLPIRDLGSVHSTNCFNLVQACQNQMIIKGLIHRNSFQSPMTYKEYTLCAANGNKEQLKGIKHLDLSDLGSEMKPEELQTILANFDKLESLNLAECFYESTSNFPYLIEYLQRSGQHLKMLNLEHARKIRVIAFKTAMSYCKNLTYLKLAYLGDGIIQAVANNCAQLTYLDIPECSYSDASISDLATGCPKIETLLLGKCVQLTEASLSILAKQFPKLTDLRLTGIRFTEEGTGPQEYNFSKLKELDLQSSNLTDRELQSLTSQCSHLKKLDLRNCVQLTGVGVRSVATNCPKLTLLYLGGIEFTNETLSFLGAQLTGLRHLEIEAISRSRIGAESELRFPNLRELILTYKSEDSESGPKKRMALLGLGCPKLTHLEFGLFVNLGDEHLKTMVASFPHLQSLEIDHVEDNRITDKGVKELGALAHLSHLTLVGCDRVTSASINHLREVNQNLAIQTDVVEAAIASPSCSTDESSSEESDDETSEVEAFTPALVSISEPQSELILQEPSRPVANTTFWERVESAITNIFERLG